MGLRRLDRLRLFYFDLCVYGYLRRGWQFADDKPTLFGQNGSVSVGRPFTADLVQRPFPLGRSRCWDYFDLVVYVLYFSTCASTATCDVAAVPSVLFRLGSAAAGNTST